MKIKSIKIEQLFEIFEYDISFSEHENVLIVTGPNGFGKTMILNIIFNLFNRQYLFFRSLLFRAIIVTLDEGTSIEINKETVGEKTTVSFMFLQGAKKVGEFELNKMLDAEIEDTVDRYLRVRKLEPDKWLDQETGRILNFDEVINEYADRLSDKFVKNFLRIEAQPIKQILDSVQVHLIREQRLFKKAKLDERSYRENRGQSIVIETIQTYSNKLKEIIFVFLQNSFSLTQELDGTYPNRLLGETELFDKQEYETRYNILKEKQLKLRDYGLYESKQEVLAYSQADAKALSVYIKDLFSKLSVFDRLVEKLELFTNILNERRFTFKSVVISKERGFSFKTSTGKDLELTQLSSGEQHEVIMLYELIFNVQPNVLVLIDEPEISLHISWQKEFLKDLLKIIKLQNTQVIVATHSPSIINDRWDLTYNLQTPSKSA